MGFKRVVFIFKYIYSTLLSLLTTPPPFSLFPPPPFLSSLPPLFRYITMDIQH